jgi:serine/threonine protein kinase
MAINNSKRYLAEVLIWKIIYQIVSACSMLQRLNNCHGSLKSENIFLDQDKLLLAETTLATGIVSNYFEQDINELFLLLLEICSKKSSVMSILNCMLIRK